MKKTLLLLLLPVMAMAQQTREFSLVTYNSLRYSPTNIDARHPHFRTIMNGIQPDILVCRTEHPIGMDIRRKLALFCNVDVGSVIEAMDAESIYDVPLLMLREKLEEIVPEASIVIGHGQMSSRQLERVIGDFTHGNYDILLATSIIESGIDMPNVNTLIVDRADWFGMSQLYQIRGRVGRSAQQAYAYFFHAGSKKLTDEARVRLETLAEHTELGAGFQISVRDLELRGAGDILSTKQTGHVATVGLQLYTQLLQQAVSAQKGDPVTQKPTYEQERIVIDLPLPAYIPGDWIQEMALRLQLYRRIGGIQQIDDVETLRNELRDRFGELPNAVEGLLYQIQVKLLATAINATHVMKPREVIEVRLPWLPHINRNALEQHLGEDVQVTRTAVELVYDDENLWQLRLIDILEALMAALPEEMGV